LTRRKLHTGSVVADFLPFLLSYTPIIWILLKNINEFGTDTNSVPSAWAILKED